MDNNGGRKKIWGEGRGTRINPYIHTYTPTGKGEGESLGLWQQCIQNKWFPMWRNTKGFSKNKRLGWGKGMRERERERERERGENKIHKHKIISPWNSKRERERKL